MCNCEHKPKTCPCDSDRHHGHREHREHHGHHGHNNHYDRNHRRYLNALPGNTNLTEVSVIPGRQLPGLPAARLARSLGFNSARQSGQQYFNRTGAFSAAYGYYT